MIIIIIIIINLLLAAHVELKRLFTAHELKGWLGSRVVSVLDSGAEGPGFKSQPRRLG